MVAAIIVRGDSEPAQAVVVLCVFGTAGLSHVNRLRSFDHVMKAARAALADVLLNPCFQCRASELSEGDVFSNRGQPELLIQGKGKMDQGGFCGYPRRALLRKRFSAGMFDSPMGDGPETQGWRFRHFSYSSRVRISAAS